MVRPSAFHAAVTQQTGAEFVMCPKCRAWDLVGVTNPNPKPTLEQEQDGSYTCTMCANNFRQSKE